MGSVMVSMLKPATIGCWDAGVATVQSPTPLLSAERPASAAAPVFPDRPGDDEQVTVGALVSFHRPRRKELADVGLVHQEGADAASHLDVRDADGNDHDAPACSAAGWSRSERFRPAKVMVSVARTV